VGSDKRLAILAQDIVEHFEKRSEAIDGKAMIVCMSRRICMELYLEIVKLRPSWENEEDNEGAIKVVMTGSASDPPDWQQHIRNKPRREALPIASEILSIRCGSCSCATCGSPASMHRACTPCTSTSRCRGMV